MFTSPYPDVDVPNLGIYDYLFGGLGEEDLDRVAIVDGASGAETTYRSLRGQIDALAGAVAAQGLGVHGVAAILCPNIPAFATVFHGLLRAGATVTTINSLYTADEIASQLTDAGAALAIHRLGPAARRAGGCRTDRDPRRPARGARRRRRPPLAGRLALRRCAGTAHLLRSRHPCGRAALLVRHHRPAQGGHAQPPEPGRQRGTVPGAARRRPRRPAAGAAPVLPHLRTDGAAEPGAAPAGQARDDAPVRAPRVPADHPGAPVQLPVHRPAGGSGADQAPAGRRVRPQLGAHRPLRCGAPGRGAGRPPGRTPRVPGPAGLRHDRDEPGVAPDPVQRRRTFRSARWGTRYPICSAASWIRPRGRTSRFPRKEPARRGTCCAAGRT